MLSDIQVCHFNNPRPHRPSYQFSISRLYLSGSCIATRKYTSFGCGNLKGSIANSSNTLCPVVFVEAPANAIIQPSVPGEFQTCLCPDEASFLHNLHLHILGALWDLHAMPLLALRAVDRYLFDSGVAGNAHSNQAHFYVKFTCTTGQILQPSQPLIYNVEVGEGSQAALLTRYEDITCCALLVV